MAWGHILYIDDLVALPTSQGTGLGTLLLQHLQNDPMLAICRRRQPTTAMNASKDSDSRIVFFGYTRLRADHEWS
jgi:hypothetical protein